jgi:hypothetical protein
MSDLFKKLPVTSRIFHLYSVYRILYLSVDYAAQERSWVVEGSCENGNEPSHSIKGGKFLAPQNDD